MDQLMKEPLRLTPLHELIVEESRFRFSVDLGPPPPSLLASLNRSGLLQPLLALKTTQGLELVDGFRRLAFLSEKGITQISCTVLPPETRLEDLFLLLLQDHFMEIAPSAAWRAKFLALALKVTEDSAVIRDTLLPALSLPPRQDILDKHLSIAALPGRTLDFFARKNLSLKQCLGIGRISEDILIDLFDREHLLGLTASLAEELAGTISDILRAKNWRSSDLFSSSEIVALFRTQMEPGERTRLLRRKLKELRYPVLLTTCDRISRLEASLKLPKNIRLHWDTSLEKQELQLSITLRSAKEWQEARDKLATDSMDETIPKILNEL